MPSLLPNPREADRIEIPAEYLPDGVSSSSMSPGVLRVAAEAHCRHRFDHDMQVKAWVVLYLLDVLEALETVRAGFDGYYEGRQHELLNAESVVRRHLVHVRRSKR